MRTTVTLDVDVERLLKKEAFKQNKSFKVVLNEAVRQGLGPHKPAKLPKLLPPVSLGIRPKYKNMTTSEIEAEMDREHFLDIDRRLKATLAKKARASGKA